MGIIKASKLIFEYIRRDEDDRVEAVNRAIDQVDVEIQKGDFVAILGHNGSGKSTLAKHINGILLPTEGTVFRHGHPGWSPSLGYPEDCGHGFPESG